jgi:hypothetical protein
MTGTPVVRGSKKSGDAPHDTRLEKKRRAARPGLPAESSVLREKTFISPGNQRYRIITTSERDAYDPPDPAARKKH